MSFNRRRFITASAALGAASLATTHSRAQGRYPERAITIIDPFSAGGNTDYVSRPLADEMARLLRQPVIVDNKAGSGGALAAEFVARAKPDGYTLGLASVSTHVANPAVNAKATDPRIIRLDAVVFFGLGSLFSSVACDAE